MNDKYLSRIRDLVAQGGQYFKVEVVVADKPSAAFSRPVVSQDQPPIHSRLAQSAATPSEFIPSQPLAIELDQNDGIDSLSELDDDILLPTPKIKTASPSTTSNKRNNKDDIEGGLAHRTYLNPAFTFKTFVEGKSNQLGLAAAIQVAENPAALITLYLFTVVWVWVKPT